jgi:hypothetical protein
MFHVATTDQITVVSACKTVRMFVPGGTQL